MLSWFYLTAWQPVTLCLQCTDDLKKMHISLIFLITKIIHTSHGWIIDKTRAISPASLPVNGTKYQKTNSLTSRHEPREGVQIHSHISIQTLQKGNSFKKKTKNTDNIFITMQDKGKGFVSTV